METPAADKHLNRCKLVLALATQNSITSDWVKVEMGVGFLAGVEPSRELPGHFVGIQATNWNDGRHARAAQEYRG